MLNREEEAIFSRKEETGAARGTRQEAKLAVAARAVVHKETRLATVAKAAAATPVIADCKRISHMDVVFILKAMCRLIFRSVRSAAWVYGRLNTLDNLRFRPSCSGQGEKR